TSVERPQDLFGVVPARKDRVRSARSVLAAGVLMLILTAPAQADDARGTGPMSRANTAWSKGEFDVAEALYHEALEQGGLSRADTLHAYVYMACARVVQNKKEQAVSAFRQAVLIDPTFGVPSEAGKKAYQLGQQVKAREARVGPFVMSLQVPPKVPSGTAFTVTVAMDASRAALLTRIGLTVTDGLGSPPYQFQEDVPQDGTDKTVQIKLDVPAKVVLPNAELRVSVAGLDRHDNELVTTAGHVSVGGGGAVGAGGPILVAHGDDGSPPKDQKRGGGFWSSPVPYIIAGAALAGAGVGIYFATKPGDSVSLASVQVHSQ
ncbi:MAG: tetratricopeptide repeat protein, partial [Polyangiaceae bacterium]